MYIYLVLFSSILQQSPAQPFHHSKMLIIVLTHLLLLLNIRILRSLFQTFPSSYLKAIHAISHFHQHAPKLFRIPNYRTNTILFPVRRYISVATCWTYFFNSVLLFLNYSYVYMQKLHHPTSQIILLLLYHY